MYLIRFIYHVSLFRLFSLFPPADISLLIGENLLQRIRNTTHIWVVTRNQYGISALVSQTSFRGEISGGVSKCRLFSEARSTDGMLSMSEKCEWRGDETSTERQRGETVSLITLQLKYP